MPDYIRHLRHIAQNPGELHVPHVRVKENIYNLFDLAADPENHAFENFSSGYKGHNPVPKKPADMDSLRVHIAYLKNLKKQMRNEGSINLGPTQIIRIISDSARYICMRQIHLCQALGISAEALVEAAADKKPSPLSPSQKIEMLSDLVKELEQMQLQYEGCKRALKTKISRHEEAEYLEPLDNFDIIEPQEGRDHL